MFVVQDIKILVWINSPIYLINMVLIKQSKYSGTDIYVAILEVNESWVIFFFCTLKFDLT